MMYTETDVDESVDWSHNTGTKGRGRRKRKSSDNLDEDGLLKSIEVDQLSFVSLLKQHPILLYRPTHQELRSKKKRVLCHVSALLNVHPKQVLKKVQNMKTKVRTMAFDELKPPQPWVHELKRLLDETGPTAKNCLTFMEENFLDDNLSNTNLSALMTEADVSVEADEDDAQLSRHVDHHRRLMRSPNENVLDEVADMQNELETHNNEDPDSIRGQMRASENRLGTADLSTGELQRLVLLKELETVGLKRKLYLEQLHLTRIRVQREAGKVDKEANEEEQAND